MAKMLSPRGHLVDYYPLSHHLLPSQIQYTSALGPCQRESGGQNDVTPLVGGPV